MCYKACLWHPGKREGCSRELHLPSNAAAGPRAQQLVLAELRQSRGSGQEEESQEHFGAGGQVEVVPNDE